jgi:Tol biopolymer transport system component
MRRYALIVVLALVVTTSASGAGALPGRILFETFPFQGFDAPYGVAAANTDGTGFVDLTAAVVRDHHAAAQGSWSPDGTKVAFALYRTHTNTSLSSAGEIWTVDADGSNPTQLTHDATDGGVSNTAPLWSPDGSRIAWLKQSGKGSDVWTMRSDGSAQQAVTTDGAAGAHNTDLSWSSDGRLAWLKRAGTDLSAANANVWLARGDGSGARALTSSTRVVAGPYWQPGGSLLLYAEGAPDSVLHVVDPSAGPPGVTIPATGVPSPPQWSSSGSQVAWGDGGGVHVSTPTGQSRIVTAMFAYGVRWSPDEHKLAFEHNQNLHVGRYDCGCASVYVVDAAGGTPRIVSGTEGAPDIGWFEPLWWPDSARLSIGGEWGVVNVNADGTCRRSFNPTNSSISGPLLWQPGAATLPPVPQCVALEGRTQAVDDTAPVGRPPQVSFTVTNLGNATAHEVTVVGLSTNGTVSSTTPGCTGGATLHCALGSLDGLASSSTIEVDVSGAKPGMLKLSFLVASAEAKAPTVALGVSLLPCALAGTDAGDRIAGTPEPDTICGFGGYDVINGLGGNDWIDGGTEADTVQGGPGDDTIHGEYGPDVLYGDAGNDTITGGVGADTIYGGPGNDHISGGLYADHLFGGPGNDFIDAGDGYRDFVDCGPGKDTVVVSTSLQPGDQVRNCERVIRR